MKPKHAGLLVGTDSETGRAFRIASKHLKTHLHVLGPTGCGKSRLLLHLFKEVIGDPMASVILLNPKGQLGAMARDWVIARGLASRLSVFDPSDTAIVTGFNPLRRSRLEVATQAKAVREAVLSGYGQSGVDQTPQLARYLFLVLAAALERSLSLVEALDLLRPGSRLRGQMLAELDDPHLYDALAYFDGLKAQRQDELAASSLARLESLVADPAIRRIVTAPRALDFETLLGPRQILIADVREYDPLRPDDVRLLGRMFVNVLLAHVFNRPVEDRHPIYFFIDEVQTFATVDLCRALDKGRELGLRCVLSHQYLEQLVLDDGNAKLRASVQNDARTKVVFGGLPVADLQALVPELVLDRFDPMAVKDERKTLIAEPIETIAQTVTHTESGARRTGIAESVVVGHGRAATRADSLLTGSGMTETDTVADKDGIPQPSFATSFSTMTTLGSTNTRARMRNWQRGRVITDGEDHGWGVAVAEAPFHRYRKHWVTATRTFWTLEEFLTTWIQRLRELPQRHFILKAPSERAVLLKAPSIAVPFVGRRSREHLRTRMLEQPHSASRTEVEACETAERAKRRCSMPVDTDDPWIKKT